jgi:hypothetical protein
LQVWKQCCKIAVNQSFFPQAESSKSRCRNLHCFLPWVTRRCPQLQALLGQVTLYVMSVLLSPSCLVTKYTLLKKATMASALSKSHRSNFRLCCTSLPSCSVTQ